MEFSIDWLAFTLPISEGEAFLDQFVRDVVPLDYGGLGYTQSALVYGTGRAYWHPERPDMGMHFSIPSSALAAWVADMRQCGREWWGPLAVCNLVKDRGGRFTRFDIAWDDVADRGGDGLLDMDVIERAARDKDLTTRWRKSQLIDNLWDGGRTIYFGSRSSDAQCRIYDKRAEQIAKDVDERILPSHWVRVELQLRRERANSAASEFVELKGRASEYFAAVLLGYLDFKRPGQDDTNKSRWDTVSWWELFLGVAEKARLYVVSKKRSIADVAAWIENQVAPTLALYFDAMGKLDADVGKFAADLLLRGRARYKRSARHRSLLASVGG